MRIFDFHTHPYIEQTENIKTYPVNEQNGYAAQRKKLMQVGISRAAGSVIYTKGETELENMFVSNEIAMKIYEEHSDFYVPGLQIHPQYQKESCEEIEKYYKKGVRLIGELVPYSYGKWRYADCNEIFDLAQNLGMVVSCHMTDDADARTVLRAFPRLRFVFAHPGEKPAYEEHLARILDFENAYLDISGTGIFRYGLLRYGINKVGQERILFGTDFPICNPGAYIGGTLFEDLTEEEKEYIFHKNAERLLGL